MYVFILIFVCVLLPVCFVTFPAKGDRKNDSYDSKQMMGHGTWAYLNIFASQLPDGNLTTSQKEETISLLHSILSQYPCLVCRSHAKEYLQSHPLEENITTAQDVQKWIHAFHNDVNRRLQKRQYLFEEFEKEWIVPYKNCDNCNN